MNKLTIRIVAISFLFVAQFTNAELLDKHWEVKRGDTLYRISRVLAPDNLSSQQRIRTEIIRLNQQVFKKGAGSLYIGARLKLPDFIFSQSTKVAQKKPEKPSASHLSKNETWRVKSGDTLYSIARVFFPASNKKQHRLRQDIKRLNPDSFYAGFNKMEVGQLLVLPGYVLSKKPEKPEVIVSAVTPAVPVISDESVSTEIQAEPENKFVKAVDQSENKIHIESSLHPSEIVEMAKDDKPEVSEPVADPVKNNSLSDDLSSSLSLSLGYSLGGDIAVSSTGGHDVAFGSGLNLKLGYDGIWNNKNGYRLVLGYQYDKVTAGDDSGEVTQSYLQGLYLYNTTTSLVGAGVSYHDNISRVTDISNVIVETDYEPAAGLVLLYEYKKLFGHHIAGISYISLESEDSVSSVKQDMSRTEIYYRLAF